MSSSLNFGIQTLKMKYHNVNNSIKIFYSKLTIRVISSRLRKVIVPLFIENTALDMELSCVLLAEELNLYNFYGSFRKYIHGALASINNFYYVIHPGDLKETEHVFLSFLNLTFLQVRLEQASKSLIHKSLPSSHVNNSNQ